MAQANQDTGDIPAPILESQGDDPTLVPPPTRPIPSTIQVPQTDANPQDIHPFFVTQDTLDRLTKPKEDVSKLAPRVPGFSASTFSFSGFIYLSLYSRAIYSLVWSDITEYPLRVFFRFLASVTKGQPILVSDWALPCMA